MGASTCLAMDTGSNHHPDEHGTSATPTPGRQVRWNNKGRDGYGGYHLGLPGPVLIHQRQGTIGVLMDGWDASPGSGFGHAHHIENGGQRYSWKEEIPAKVFGVAVTIDELIEAEESGSGSPRCGRGGGVDPPSPATRNRLPTTFAQSTRRQRGRS